MTTLAKWATTLADEKIYPEDESRTCIVHFVLYICSQHHGGLKDVQLLVFPNPQSLPTGQLAEGAAKNLLPTRVGEGDAITDRERQNQEKWK